MYSQTGRLLAIDSWGHLTDKVSTHGNKALWLIEQYHDDMEDEERVAFKLTLKLNPTKGKEEKGINVYEALKETRGHKLVWSGVGRYVW